MTSAIAGALLHQLSYEATKLGAGQFVGVMCSSKKGTKATIA